MRDADRFKLLGTYKTPRVRVGTVLACEARDCDVIVTGYTDAHPVAGGLSPRAGRVPGPGRLRGPRRAVGRESNQAVCYWFGVTAQTVS